jgi:hypothetical protein
MADTSLPVTPGSGVNVDGFLVTGNGNFRQAIVIADPSVPGGAAPVDSILGLAVQVMAFPAGVSIAVTNFPATQTIAGTVAVSNFPAVQIVSATSWPLPTGASTEATLALIKAKTDNLDVALSTRTKPSDTQAVSAASLPLPAGASTAAKQPALGVAGTASADVLTIQGIAGMTAVVVSGSVAVTNFPATQTIAGTVAVSNFPATQPVSIASMPSTPVTGTFFQATQPVSLVSVPLPTGAATAAKQPALGTAGTPSADVISVQGEAGMTPVTVYQQGASLVQSVTAATGVAVTVTLPAVAGQFHYITLIEIVKYFTVANAASATPLVVTTTNLPGSLAFTFGQPLGTVGTTDRMLHNPNSPLKSSVVNTATTIVCPATTGIIWRVNVYYYAAP